MHFLVTKDLTITGLLHIMQNRHQSSDAFLNMPKVHAIFSKNVEKNASLLNKVQIF